jgi:5-methylcytosine-specific restriction endonuclease McrA
MEIACTVLSDAELVARLEAFCVEGHGLSARVVACLMEVEERRLHLEAACSSLFDYCVRRLRMSEGAAFRRINAARLAKRFPSLLGRIERGEIHLSSLVLLRDHLTGENIDELVSEASGKTQRQIAELLARRAPRPDVPSTIRRLPVRSSGSAALPSPSNEALAPKANPPSARRDARVEPLSAERYKVQLTVSVELRDKLERARDLMRHRNPSGDLAVVVDRALDLLLEKLEKERLGRTTRPERTRRREKNDGVSRATRRAVFARDGEQCTFVDVDGNRCPAKGFLELDHVEPRALGGSHGTENLRVACRAHNLFYAERAMGTKAEHFRRRKSASTPPSRQGLDDAVDREAHGLVGMGFRESDARRALAAVFARHAAEQPPPPIHEVLREALAILT